MNDYMGGQHLLGSHGGSHPYITYPLIWVADHYWAIMSQLSVYHVPTYMGSHGDGCPPTTYPLIQVVNSYWAIMGRLPWPHAPTNMGGQPLLGNHWSAALAYTPTSMGSQPLLGSHTSITGD
ncbi:uncharacterized protein EDB91DRAFT_1087572 [Suillus paluster]|uniref:uncharacterized protein n=1 Tax=Suillus paluster TaxID=48578 RepID=UPI001B85F1BB|nr:uncharacterized protein EDB91DRAFT_1087572 [Suillus paluster]KAG1724152.1 hypothetical protein EDB91DRAFT_1087572 [Suillus paluster]